MIRNVVLLLFVGNLVGCTSGDEGTEMHLEDPTTVSARGGGNSYLACPPGSCRLEADRESPSFSLSIETVEAAWQRVIDLKPRTERLAENPSAHIYHYRQVSRVFRFPDIISVKFLEAEEGGTTLVVLSRSVVGSYDFGVNKSRVEEWLQDLERETRGAT